LLVESDGIPAAAFEAVTRAAARFVAVFDADDGKLLAGPQSAAKANDTGPGGDTTLRWRFQFNLQSRLLLTVVVSCAASCYGIHDRRLRPQREAVTQLQAFGTKVDYIGETVCSVDFGACTTQPGDDDLICLKELRDLGRLDLDGLPISDAGLKHLYSMKSLRSVWLGNTNVTKKGVDALKRALPNTQVDWHPPRAGAK
jgi:hypothetical protein